MDKDRREKIIAQRQEMREFSRQRRQIESQPVAAIAEKNGDQASAARWLTKADEWNRNLERWTVTRNGSYSAEPYFIRLSVAGEPDSGAPLELNNGAGTFDERTIVDAGFLELVRLGIRSADDPLIAARLHMKGASAAEVFGELRERKNKS